MSRLLTKMTFVHSCQRGTQRCIKESVVVNRIQNLPNTLMSFCLKSPSYWYRYFSFKHETRGGDLSIKRHDIGCSRDTAHLAEKSKLF